MYRTLLLNLFFIFSQTDAVIYQLNDTEYARMPPVFHLDPYELCVHRNGGIYCTIDIDLVADDNNELFNMIQEYSERKETHLNHSRIYHGICVTKTCVGYLNQNTSDNLKTVVERCLNDSYWNNYNLKTKLNKEINCNIHEGTNKLELADVAVAVIFLCFFIFSFVGSGYDLLAAKENEGNKWLLCFSVRRNWRKLTATGDGANSRTQRLKGLDGLRVITICLVITEHSMLPFIIASDNTHYMENSYNKLLNHLLFDGTVVVQTFFIISGCLLALHLQMYSEKRNLTWKMLPKGVFLRWLRLTPSYAAVLVYIMTWARFGGSGPLWHKVLHVEIQDCRRDGWLNMIYLNNYIDGSQCMMHTWYLAADMQLFILGFITLLLAKSKRTRKMILSMMFAVSLLFPALHTYFQNLYAYFTITPEFVRGLFRNDPTFNTYRRGHTNMASYIIGLSLGLLIHTLQQRKFDIERYRKFKYLYWALFPVGIGVILFNGIFYIDGVEPPVIYRAVYAALSKAIVGVILFAIIFGMVFKIENTYRSILEWQGWTTPARVSYAAYLLHLIVIQLLTGTRTTLIHITGLQVGIVCMGTTVITFLIAVPFWLLVEAPVTQLVKVALPTGDDKDKTQL